VAIQFPAPDLQIEFSVALAEIRRRYLQDALFDTVKTLDIATLDKQLADFVPAASLAIMAAKGLRAELAFPVPLLLGASPWLLGYYRLLYGFSQKFFYTAQTGAGSFRMMEDRGVVGVIAKSKMPELCHALVPCGIALLEGVGPDRVNARLLDDLTLLTVGPQLRGGANVKRGAAGIVQVFGAIHKIVQGSAQSANETQIIVKNAAGRRVLIEFAPDPDIIIREEMTPIDPYTLAAATFAEKIAIEVKAGQDFSNIHNRIGEAEKSHQKAKARGFVECWTVVNVDAVDLAMAKQESPSTNRFYRLSAIQSGTGPEYADFRDRLLVLAGIKG
jgi:hypothetical protein